MVGRHGPSVARFGPARGPAAPARARPPAHSCAAAVPPLQGQPDALCRCQVHVTGQELQTSNHKLLKRDVCCCKSGTARYTQVAASRSHNGRRFAIRANDTPYGDSCKENTKLLPSEGAS